MHPLLPCKQVFAFGRRVRAPNRVDSQDIPNQYPEGIYTHLGTTIKCSHDSDILFIFRDPAPLCKHPSHPSRSKGNKPRTPAWKRLSGPHKPTKRHARLHNTFPFDTLFHGEAVPQSIWGLINIGPQMTLFHGSDQSFKAISPRLLIKSASFAFRRVPGGWSKS